MMKAGRLDTSDKQDLNEYRHKELNREYRFISGYCVFTDEIRMVFEGRALLYLIGHGVLDTACCGTTGCGYALVQGFVIKWKYKKNIDGHFVSQLTPVRKPGLRLRIQNEILKRELIQQVLFA